MTTPTNNPATIRANSACGTVTVVITVKGVTCSRWAIDRLGTQRVRDIARAAYTEARAAGQPRKVAAFTVAEQIAAAAE